MSSQRNQSVRNAGGVAAPARRGLYEGALIGLLAIAIYLSLALFSYDPGDPGWTHAGLGGELRNAGGATGAWMSDVLFLLFGYVAFLLPLILLHRAWLIFHERANAFHITRAVLVVRLVGVALLVSAACALATLHFSHLGAGLPAGSGGVFGQTLAGSGLAAFSYTGSTLLYLALLLVGVTAFTDLSWLWLMDETGRLTLRAWSIAETRFLDWRERRQERARVEAGVQKRRAALSRDQEERKSRKSPEIAPKVNVVEKSTRVQKEKQQPLFRERDGDTLPRLGLLETAVVDSEKGYSKEALEALSRLLEIKLREYGVEVQVVEVQPGPVVTRFEVQPAAGVKASRITGLARDLARSMAVISVRVVEVIPGKSTVGLEIPNEDREIVRLSEVLSSREYDESHSPLIMGLGKDIAGRPVVADLAKMPHMLVAGTTGSGKSVALNAMLLSLLFKSTPEEVRLIMIDPKMVELSVYNGVPHLLAPVVTDMKDAVNALRWCVAEMERRYLLMNHLKVRNMAGYNRKVAEALKAGEPIPDPLWKEEDSLETEAPQLEHLPLIVVIVDEFADLLMSLGDKGKKLEEMIARIAQKARAAGIHMILATQRPDSKVITGLIRANVPCKIAFQVSDKVQSRVILEQNGAEQLLGQGDMLYLPSGKPVPERVHGAFVSDDEVMRVVEDWKQRGEPEYIDEIITGPEGGEFAGDFSLGDAAGGDAEQDEFYDQACAYVLKTRRVSVSSIQRQLRIGYNRASRIVEAMESAGLVSSMGHNGQREVLVPSHD